MAEAAFDIPADLEKTEPRVFSWRRNSTGNINTRISEPKVVLPRYLSAPFASCHDSCKYGTKRNNDEAARTPLHKRSASKQRKIPASAEPIDMQMEKKFTTTLRLASTPKKQTTSPAIRQEVIGRDVKRVIPVSAEHKSSSKTKGISRSSQKGTTVQPSKSGATSTKHRNRSILREASQQSSPTRQTRRQTKQDGADEENVPEKTLFVIKEHKEDSTNRESSCSPASKFNSSEETELNPEQENVSNLPRKLVFRRGKIVDGKLYKDGGSPRKVVQYIFVEGKKDSVKLFDSMMEETENKPAAENRLSNVKTLIGVFESVISLQDGSSSPALR